MKQIFIATACLVLANLFDGTSGAPAQQATSTGTATERAESIPLRRQVPLAKSVISKSIRKLKPLAEKIPPAQAGEWLATHEERGQTYAQYVRSRPNVLTRERNVLYVQPIGEFSETQQRLVTLTAEYLTIYFNCDVKVLDTKSEQTIPAAAQRNHPEWGDHQLLTSHILEKILAPELPRDAFATIAFTTSDLWPGDGWNFVFGYASFRDRVGVWSLSRFGDPDEGNESFRKCLLRTIKVATHETGHMFSMPHCTAYRCNMQGSNSLVESDRQPLALCPECHAKILLACGVDPVVRYGELIAFCEREKLVEPLEFFRAAKLVLSDGRRVPAD